MMRDRDLALAIGEVLAFLLPIGFYCLILASINRRSRPLIVSGIWDSVGLLSAISGFFLITVPMLLADFYARTLGSGNLIGDLLSQWLLWLIYFLFLISGSVLMLLWRSHKTLIYNVDTEQLPKALERTLTAVGLEAAMRKERLILVPIRLVPGAKSTEFMEAAPKPAAPPDRSRHAELEIESFSSMCHITLHWDNYAPSVRREIEAELGRGLESSAPLENPAASWFLNISGMIFGMLIIVVLMFAALILFSRR